jgi:SH3-like domain-containing protein
MRRFRTMILLGILLLTGATVWAGSQMFSLQIRSGKLRATPSFLGKVAATVDYGAQLELLAEQGPWVKVRDTAGHSGWIHRSALTEKKLVLKAGDQDVAETASGTELALAGKGFNAEVEAEFKSKNSDVDFTWVDRMESYRVSADQSLEFLLAGGVISEGGGQ